MATAELFQQDRRLVRDGGAASSSAPSVSGSAEV
jgi:hypothetical protein